MFDTVCGVWVKESSPILSGKEDFPPTATISHPLLKAVFSIEPAQSHRDAENVYPKLSICGQLNCFRNASVDLDKLCKLLRCVSSDASSLLLAQSRGQLPP